MKLIMRPLHHFICFFFVLTILSACGGGGTPNASSTPISQTTPATQSLPPLPTGPISYVVPTPESKLPYPQHAPQFSKAEYELMRQSTWILNNFALYQGDDKGENYMYLHDGLDFMLKDGTAVYAVMDGIVRDTSNSAISVENPLIKGSGWQFAHIDVDPRLKLGDKIWRGQYVGVVAKGNEHTHFNWINQADSGSWVYATTSRYPSDLFDLDDTMAPVFDSDFRFFENASAREFKRGEALRGKVDIVAAIRDTSPNHPKNYNIRSAPASFIISVSKLQGDIVWERRPNLRHYILTPPFLGDKTKARKEVELLFKVPQQMEERSWTAQGKTWWILSNLPSPSTPQKLSVSDEDMFWDTSAIANGNYRLRVLAIDSKGNQASKEQDVRVEN